MSDTLRQLKEGVPTYQSNERIRKEVQESGKTFTPVVGPFGVGKTTIVTRVTELDPTIQPISTTTNRPRKHKTDPQNFRTASEGITLDMLIDDIQQGNVLNYDVIVETGTIYATPPDGLTAQHNIGPFTAASIDTFQKLHMKHFTPVYIVSPVALWSDFIRTSLGERHDLAADRAPEAIASAEFALEHLDVFDFVESRKGSIDAAARTIIAITRGKPHTALDKQTAQEMLKDMITYAKSLA